MLPLTAALATVFSATQAAAAAAANVGAHRSWPSSLQSNVEAELINEWQWESIAGAAGGARSRRIIGGTAEEMPFPFLVSIRSMSLAARAAFRIQLGRIC